MNIERKDISVIIPSAKNEPMLDKILESLKTSGFEIIVSREGSRAKSMNEGVKKANGSFLWFLHADSDLSELDINSFLSSLNKSPGSIHYFKLKFSQRGPVSANAFMANVRSKLFSLPYGDQAFCLSKDNFITLGGYSETASFGEDVLFIRKAKKLGIPLSLVNQNIITSARKYNKEGWLKTSFKHQLALYTLLKQEL